MIALPRDTGYYQERGDPGDEDALSPSTGHSWWKTAHWWGQKPGKAQTVHPTREKTIEVSAHGSSLFSGFTSPEEQSHHFFTGLHQHLLPCRVNNVELLKGEKQAVIHVAQGPAFKPLLFHHELNTDEKITVRNGREGF